LDAQFHTDDPFSLRPDSREFSLITGPEKEGRESKPWTRTNDRIQPDAGRLRKIGESATPCLAVRAPSFIGTNHLLGLKL
jgi:hypothetical protein